LYPKGTTATIGDPVVIPVEIVEEEVMDTE